MDPDLEIESWKHPGRMLGGELGEGLGIEAYGLLGLGIIVASAIGLLILA